MATITKNVRENDTAGVRNRRCALYTGPASYVNPGGDVITAAELGLGKIEKFIVDNIVPDDNGANLRIISVNYAADRTSVTIRWWVTDLATEVANAVDLSAYDVQYEAIGK